ncbi:MAG: YjbH domain-containing protein, partial [Acidobacteria bacterium]|nr:YjbH domain-containing protein [Acidobacteriota bacterium]
RKFKYPNADYSAGIDLRTYLFDPDSPLLVRPSINVRGAVDFGGGWGLDGEWVQSLSNQFDRIKRDGNSQLPPVRTDLKRYLQEGDSGIERLAIVQRGKLGRDLYYQAFGGILEEMYSGVGAEVLWRRADLPFAVGVNVIAVQQREFDKMLGLRDYKTVIGHVSGYWATGFHNFDLAVHAGRYLAKDIGATFEIQKRFANGWSVGAFATLTDVPFEVFGEGSFDKGLIFRVPLDSYTRRNSRGAFRTILRSINRDGGRMIENWSGQLWESMRPTHGDMLENSRDRMVPDND